jgi:hypothetical protein
MLPTQRQHLHALGSETAAPAIYDAVTTCYLASNTQTKEKQRK